MRYKIVNLQLMTLAITNTTTGVAKAVVQPMREQQSPLIMQEQYQQQMWVQEQEDQPWNNLHSIRKPHLTIIN